MKEITEFSVDELNFTSYDRSDKEFYGKNIRYLTFKGRHDFVYNEDFAGIAVEIDFSNSGFFEEPARGVCRKVEFTLIDQNERIPVYSEIRKIRIPRSEFIRDCYLDLSATKIEFKTDHIYRLVVRDLTMEAMLGEYVFRLYSQEKYGRPTQWYGVKGGGIYTPESKALYKSKKVEEYEECHVGFVVNLEMGKNRPSILPELEIWLHCTASGKEKNACMDPRPLGNIVGQYYVEIPFFPDKSDIGVYYAELLCMGHPIAGFVFDTTVDAECRPWSGTELEPMGHYDEEKAMIWAEERLGQFMSFTPFTQSDPFEGCFEEEDEEDCPLVEPATPDGDEEDEAEGSGADETSAPKPTLAESLSELTGLHSVKDKLLAYENVVRFNKLRCDNGLPAISMPLHAMFLGSPGTGKTTVAKMLGGMLRDMGVLSSGHVVVRERATLLGQYYSSEADKTLEALEEAKGGILFIDEAYQLYQPADPRDPGRFVIETLLTSLSDESKRDWMLVLAGYPEPMLKMLELNPGFKSRIPASNIYRFEDFSGEELIEMARRYFERLQYRLTQEADEALMARLRADYEYRDRTFGNGRYVMNLIQTEILPAMAKRVVCTEGTDSSSLTDIMAADIPPFVPRAAQAAPRIGFAI